MYSILFWNATFWLHLPAPFRQWGELATRLLTKHYNRLWLARSHQLWWVHGTSVCSAFRFRKTPHLLCLDCGDPCVWECYSTDAFDVDWVGSYVSHARNWLHRDTNDYISLAHSPPQITRTQELTMFSFLLQDIMVCTGCCGTLDFIVTHLYKTLSKRRKKNLTGMEPQPPCLRILESHPEMIQQVSWTKCSRFLTWFRFFLKTGGKEVDNGWVTVFSSEGKTEQFKKDSEIKPP